jgi:hypothetical protein
MILSSTSVNMKTKSCKYENRGDEIEIVISFCFHPYVHVYDVCVCTRGRFDRRNILDSCLELENPGETLKQRTFQARNISRFVPRNYNQLHAGFTVILMSFLLPLFSSSNCI